MGTQFECASLISSNLRQQGAELWRDWSHSRQNPASGSSIRHEVERDLCQPDLSASDFAGPFAGSWLRQIVDTIE
jgi:hypothetical protein